VPSHPMHVTNDEPGVVVTVAHGPSLIVTFASEPRSATVSAVSVKLCRFGVAVEGGGNATYEGATVTNAGGRYAAVSTGWPPAPVGTLTFRMSFSTNMMCTPCPCPGGLAHVT